MLIDVGKGYLSADDTVRSFYPNKAGIPCLIPDDAIELTILEYREALSSIAKDRT